MTLLEVQNAISGYHRRLERQMKHDYSVMRYQTAVLLSPHVEKGKQIKPHDVLQFPEEIKKEKNKIKPFTPQDKEVMDRWDQEYQYIPN
jgi:hypothetical protein